MSHHVRCAHAVAACTLWFFLGRGVTPLVHAIDFHWTGGGSDPSFNNPLNWSPGSTSTSWPDTSADAVLFDTLAASYTVDWDNTHDNERFEVRTGNPTFQIIDGTLPRHYHLHTTTEPAAIVSSFPGGLFSPQLTINGVSHATLGQSSVNSLQILQIAVGGTDTSGTMNLNNVRWDSSSAAFIGLNGNGALNTNSTAVVVTHSGVLGFTNFSVGTANISDEWELFTADLVVGRSGTGHLNISGSSANVHTNAGYIAIAQNPGSIGDVTLSSDGRLQSDGSLYVGGGPSGPGGNASLVSTGFVLGEDITVGDDLIIYGNGTVNLALGNRLYVENDTFIHTGGSLVLNDGDFVTQTLTGPANSVTWTQDEFFVQDEIVIDENAPLGGTVSVSNFFGQKLTTNLLKVGPTAAGTLNLTGEAGGGFVEIGSPTPGIEPATVNLINSAAGLDTVSIDVRGTTNAALNVQGGSRVHHLFASRFAEFPGTNATVNITNTGTMWDGGSPLYIAGNLDTPGGNATVSLSDNAAMDINDLLKIWPGGNMTVDNATLTIDNLDVHGSLTLQNDATFNPNALTEINVSGSLFFGTGTAINLPTLNITEGGHVTFANQFITIDPLGSGNIDDFTLDGGTLSALLTPVTFKSATFFGNGSIDAVVIAEKGVFANGNLNLGRPDVVNAVRISEDYVFTIGGHNVTLHQKNFWDMHPFTSLSGGTLAVPNGLTLRPGLYFDSHGTVQGRISANGGTTIEADGGDLTIGDPTSLAGFFSDGEFITGPNTVTIHDANQAVLGTLTTLGVTGGASGDLVAPNGLLLEFGKNIQDHGTIDTPNDPATPLTNLGHIQGNSPAEPITLNGYITGIGSFANVVINGTLAPGLSLGAITVNGDLASADEATLLIELAGASPEEYDRVHVAGTLTAAGTTTVALLDGYRPTPGTTYRLLDFANSAGDFAANVATNRARKQCV